MIVCIKEPNEFLFKHLAKRMLISDLIQKINRRLVKFYATFAPRNLSEDDEGAYSDPLAPPWSQIVQNGPYLRYCLQT